MKNTISIEQPRSNAWQRVKWQYVSLAAGLALAATAAVGFGGTSNGTTTAAPAPSKAASYMRPLAETDHRTVVFYLTANQEQVARANALEDDALWVRLGNGSPEPRRSVTVLDAASVPAETEAYRLIEDAMAASNFSDKSPAPTFVVTDLR